MPVIWFSDLDMEFEISKVDEVAADLEGLLAGNTNLKHEVDLWRLAARAFHLAKNEEQRNKCQSEAAECLVTESKKHSSAMLEAHWLTAAISQLHGLPNKKERRSELRHLLIDVQGRISEEMKLFSQELDVKEIADKVKELSRTLGSSINYSSLRIWLTHQTLRIYARRQKINTEASAVPPF